MISSILRIVIQKIQIVGFINFAKIAFSKSDMLYAFGIVMLFCKPEVLNTVILYYLLFGFRKTNPGLWVQSEIAGFFVLSHIRIMGYFRFGKG